MQKMLVGQGGYVGYFGSNDAYAVEKAAIAGDPKAELLEEAFAYQVAKQIGENACVLKGKVDGILLTGGLMRFDDIRAGIEDRCGWIAPVSVYPGELEQEALAWGALAAVRGECPVLTYTGKPVWGGFPGVDFKSDPLTLGSDLR